MASSKPIRRVKSRDLSEVPDQSKGNDGIKLQDKYEMYSIPDNSNGEFLSIRTIGGLVATKTHWIMLETKDGKQVSVPKACLNFDVEEQCIKEDNNCPYCRAEQWFKDHEVSAKDRNGRESNPARSSVEHITNAIVRDLQEDITPRVTLPEEKKTGIINKGSKSKTPVRVIRLTGGIVSKFKDVEKLNVHKVKVKGGGEERRSLPISHPKYGRDVMIKFNAKAKSASEYYGVQGGDKSPLDADELALLKWDIEAWPFENEPESHKDAESEIMRLKGKHWDKFRKHSGVKDQSDDYDDEDDEDFDDEMDDEEDERPSKKKGKTPAKSKSKSRRDDDEDEDDEDDEDDFDDEDEDDEEDFDDEDEDDEPPAKKKGSASKTSGKKSSKKRQDDDEDEDEDDLDDLDDDEEDEPPRKSKSKKAPVKSKSKSRRDEEDFDDEDEDDEDDEPPRKSSKKAPAKGKGRATKGKSKRQDDDEDDDLPF